MKRKAPKKRYRAAKVLHARRYAPKRIESKKRKGLERLAIVDCINFWSGR